MTKGIRLPAGVARALVLLGLTMILVGCGGGDRAFRRRSLPADLSRVPSPRVEADRGAGRGVAAASAEVEPELPAIRRPEVPDDRGLAAVELPPRLDIPPPALPPPPEIVPLRPESTARPAVIDPKRLIASARDRLADARTYQVTITRQERIGTRLGDPEVVLLSVRRSPRALRMEWPEGKEAGREVIYAVEGGDGKIHVRKGAKSIVPPLALAPDNPLIARNSRHPIATAGFEGVLAELERTLKAGPATVGPIEVFPDHEAGPGLGSGPAIARTAPDGNRWVTVFDDQTKFPMLAMGTNPQGELLERYAFRDVRLNPSALDDPAAFDPDARWGKSSGWFNFGKAEAAPTK